MKIETLYRYKRNSGKMTVSPKKPTDRTYTEVYRLFADLGMMLTNGEIITSTIDVDNTEGWTEIEEPKEEPIV